MTMLFEKIKKRVSPERRIEILSDIVIDPLLVFSKLLLLFALLFLAAKYPIEHVV